MLITFLLSMFLLLAPDSEPKKGDTYAIVFTEFTSTEEALDYVVKDVLLPMDIIPLRYDAHLGFLVTERTLFKGYYNCDYVFTFLVSDGKVQVKCWPRDYEASKTMDTFSGYSPSYYPKAMKDSPAKAYWDKFQQIVSSIPSISYIYGGADEEKQIKEIHIF